MLKEMRELDYRKLVGDKTLLEKCRAVINLDYTDTELEDLTGVALQKISKMTSGRRDVSQSSSKTLAQLEVAYDKMNYYDSDEFLGLTITEKIKAVLNADIKLSELENEYSIPAYRTCRLRNNNATVTSLTGASTLQFEKVFKSLLVRGLITFDVIKPILDETIVSRGNLKNKIITSIVNSTYKSDPIFIGDTPSRLSEVRNATSDLNLKGDGKTIIEKDCGNDGNFDVKALFIISARRQDTSKYRLSINCIFNRTFNLQPQNLIW